MAYMHAYALKQCSVLHRFVSTVDGGWMELLHYSGVRD
jgi:hypothetical protein